MSTGPQADSQQLAELYRAAILENAAAPCGHGRDIDHTHRAVGDNVLCGDVVDLRLRVTEGVIEAAAFHGESCAICMASASLLCRHMEGRSVAAVGTTRDAFEAAIAQGEGGELPEWLQPMLGVRAYPARTQCALLPWKTAGRALADSA